MPDPEFADWDSKHFGLRVARFDPRATPADEGVRWALSNAVNVLVVVSWALAGAGMLPGDRRYELS